MTSSTDLSRRDQSQMGTVTSEESNNLRKVQDEGMKQVHTINKRWEKKCKAAKKKEHRKLIPIPLRRMKVLF